MPCGSVLDYLRSCYTTNAVLAEGELPQLIYWWWADKDAPLAGRHSFGSNNWSHPRSTQGGLGEDPSIKPEWYNGAKPANACGGAAGLDCDVTTLPATLYCQIEFNGLVDDFTIPFIPGQNRWAGNAPNETGTCGTTAFVVTCDTIPSGTPPARQWRLEVLANTPSGTVSDFGTFPATGPATPFLWQLALTEIKQACGGNPTEAAAARVSSTPIGRR